MTFIAIAKAIRTNLNTETKTRQYASLQHSCPLPFAITREISLQNSKFKTQNSLRLIDRIYLLPPTI